jgi:hypothetical protein
MSNGLLTVPRLVVVAGLALVGYWMMGGFGLPSFRYKLAFAVETPDGIKTGFNVVEVSHRSVSIPASGTMTRARGEALYLDLGPGRRPLIALLSGPRDRRGDGTLHWGEMSPFEVLARLYGEPFKDYGTNNANILKLVRYRGPKPVVPSSGFLPDLVTFANVLDPKTVMLVDPNNIGATLGPDVKWHKITLEITDEPLTTGIEAKLPWLPAYFDKMLDGQRPGKKRARTFASGMNTAAFQTGRN